MEIINVNKPSMPEQVQANTENIKLLADRIQDVYVANIELSNDATTINSLNIKNWNTQATTGFILDTTGKLFKIVAVSDNIIYIEYWSTLVQGPQGPQGPIGPQGPQGNDGSVEDITRINMQVGEPNVIYDTEDGITVLAQGNIQTETGSTSNPETEMNIPLIAGNGLAMDATEDGKHVDIHLSLYAQTQLSRALTTPLSIPTEDEVVGIGTNGAQIRIDKKDLIQSSPNLLINGNFEINQRGKEVYNTLGYCVDRWYFNGNTDDTLVVEFNSKTKIFRMYNITGSVIDTNRVGLYQYIENSEELLGKNVTISVKINGVLYSVSGKIDDSYSEDTDIISTTTEYSSATNYGSLLLSWNNDIKKLVFKIAFNSVLIDFNNKVEEAKLEVGSVATPYSPRPYAEELAMCQRYYQELFDVTFAPTAYYASPTRLIFPVEMRTTPTVKTYPANINGVQTSNNEKTLYDINTNSEITVGQNAGYATTKQLAMAGAGLLTANNRYGYIVKLDAEIY